MSYTTWGQVSQWASQAGAKFPELVAAQWALESSWGSAVSGRFNFFGLKGSGSRVKTTEFIDGEETQLVAEFMDFDDPRDCVQYLVDRWYKDFKGYKGVNNAKTREDAARMLVSEKYATDPDYSEKLIKLMSTNAVPSSTQSSASTGSVGLKAAARWYAAKPHQDKAWDALEASLTADQLALFSTSYRAAPQEVPVVAGKSKFPLAVPYFYQRDSKTGHGERSCQSSAIAMVVEYLRPDLISDDDDYLKTVFRYGDTVSQAAQAKALDSLGLKHKFKTNGSEAELIRLLDAGYPVPIGILHKGDVSSPSGGGHWITLTGYDDKSFFVQDPFGELDLVNGGYPLTGPRDGKDQRYSRKNLMKRWLIHGSSDGWLWDLSENQKR